ncbi:helix-turn-helix domain-containing protein [Actinomadura viridis]|uniref:helix-turn-helix domain-containing protein n=1 Tax=Actinomadura viridis TaxID=58110 RepID=UPI0036AC725F
MASVQELVTLREISSRVGRSIPTVHRWSVAWNKANREAGEAGEQPPCPQVRDRQGNRGGVGEKGTRLYDWAEVNQWWLQSKAPTQIDPGDPNEMLTAEQIADLRGIAVKTLRNEISDGRFPPAGPAGTWRRSVVVAEMRARGGRGVSRSPED